MKIKQFLTKVLAEKVKTENLKIIEKKFAPLKITADEAKYLISAIQSEPIFFEDEMFYRLLSIQEILDADVYMNVPFKKIGILPCIDCWDNDFISYDFRSYTWCKYNIVEEVKFASKNSIFEYFN